MDLLFPELLSVLNLIYVCNACSFDVETLSVCEPEDRIETASTVEIGYQPLFMIGVSAVDYLSLSNDTLADDDELINERFLAQPDRYMLHEYFLIDQSTGVPRDDKIQELVDRFLSHLLAFSAKIGQFKRARLDKYVKFLTHQETLWMNNNRFAKQGLFKFSMFGEILTKLRHLMLTYRVVGFNSERYDLVVLMKNIFVFCKANGYRPKFAKAGNSFKFLSLPGISFEDVYRLFPCGSLSKVAETLNLKEGLFTRKTFMPHSFYSSLDTLYSSAVPPFFDRCWFKMNDSSSKICTQTEYDRFKAQFTAPEAASDGAPPFNH
jgi:hypothetical protein